MSPIPARRPAAFVAILILLLGLACSLSARAESRFESGVFQFYMGGGGGASPMTLDSRDYSMTGNFVTQVNGFTEKISQDETFSGSYKGFVGIRFLKYFGVEAGVGHLGTIGFTAEGVGGSGALSYAFTDRGDYTAGMTYVAALLTLPTGTDGSYFHLKGGSAQVKVDVTETFTQEYRFLGVTVEEVYKSSTTMSRPLIGVGYTTHVGTGQQFRVELEYLGEIGKPYMVGTNDGTGRASVMMVTASYMLAF
jgi:hypothetical protein